MKLNLHHFAVSTLNKIHKINSVALFVLFVPVFSFTSAAVTENGIVSTVTTKIQIEHDGKKELFSTQRFTLQDALKDKNIQIEDKDAVYPEKSLNLIGGDLQIRISRAVPILLDDNGKKKIIYSGYTDQSLVLRQNNIKLYKEDKISSELVSDAYKDQSVGQKITIKRAPLVFINVDGQKKESRTWLQKVADVLNEKKILIGDKDKIEPDRNSKVKNGTQITITRVAESEVKENEEIEFQETVIEDTNTFVGQDFIKQAGQKGTKGNVFKLISENGNLVSKTLIDSTLLKEPVGQIRVKGAKPYNATTLWPTIVAAADQYGVSASKMHAVMICESGGNPYSGSFYKGLFQYHPDTWAGASAAYPGGAYAGASIYDPIAQIYVTAWKVSNQGWSGWGCA